MKLGWFKKKQSIQKASIPESVESVAVTNGSSNGIKEIHTLEELDQEIAAVHEAFGVSDDAGFARLLQFRYVIDKPFPKDPYSQEYRDLQFEIYREISGNQSYDPLTNEKSPFDIDAGTFCPFPYRTSSAAIVSEQLIMQGFLIRVMNLPPKSSILEFGPGWGNTTLHFAQMGYDVTGLEIEPGFIELIKRRAELFKVDVKLIRSDMATFKPNQRYDAVVFFESFHHCSDHLGLLRSLEEMINPDGMIAFAAEPIVDFPHPWGMIRTDGLAIWSIRNMGWLELGFDTSYFLRTLLFFGWSPKRHLNTICPNGNVITAKRSNGIYHMSELSLPPDEDRTWAVPEATHRFTTGHSVFSCDQSSTVAEIELLLSNPAPFDLDVTVTAGSKSQTMCVSKFTHQQPFRVPVADWKGTLMIDSATWSPFASLGLDDHRKLGVAVHTITLIYSPH